MLFHLEAIQDQGLCVYRHMPQSCMSSPPFGSLVGNNYAFRLCWCAGGRWNGGHAGRQRVLMHILDS